MEYEKLGRTQLKVSKIGFGCGGTGAIMVKGSLSERLEAVQYALGKGINYFDTAPAYGNGASESNLGEILRLITEDVIVSSKVRPLPEEWKDLQGSITKSVDNSLKRLNLDVLDIIQIHNHLTEEEEARFGMSVSFDRLMHIAEILRDVQSMGKVRFIGFTGLGEPGLIHKVIESNVFDTVQVYYNLLQTSAGYELPEINGVENYSQLLSKTADLGIGTIAIRVLAGGILTDSPPNADDGKWPVMSLGNDLKGDIEKAKSLLDFLPRWPGTLQELATRFVLSDPRVSTALIGFSGVKHIDEGVAAVENGRLDSGLLESLKKYWAQD